MIGEQIVSLTEHNELRWATDNAVRGKTGKTPRTQAGKMSNSILVVEHPCWFLIRDNLEDWTTP